MGNEKTYRSKRELELEIELRKTRVQLFIANARIMELQSSINQAEIDMFSAELNSMEGEKESADAGK